MSQASPLEHITDATGAVTFGWVADRVYYARFSGSLSARLGEAFAARLKSVITSSRGVRYFADGSALESYDLRARRAFLSVVAKHRARFESLTLLGWEDPETSPAVLAPVGEGVLLTGDPYEFDRRLFTLAPHCRHRLHPHRQPSPRARWLRR
jgi:hypothetical protein